MHDRLNKQAIACKILLYGLLANRYVAPSSPRSQISHSYSYKTNTALKPHFEGCQYKTPCDVHTGHEAKASELSNKQVQRVLSII